MGQIVPKDEEGQDLCGLKKKADWSRGTFGRETGFKSEGATVPA